MFALGVKSRMFESYHPEAGTQVCIKTRVCLLTRIAGAGLRKEDGDGIFESIWECRNAVSNNGNFNEESGT